jgi:hypothetical protein
MIFLYDTTKGFKIFKKIKSHHSTITHLDYSLDGGALMSNDTSYEILFHDT